MVMCLRKLEVTTLSALAGLVLGAGAVQAAPQSLALVATEGAVELTCEGGACAAEFSTFCLQMDRVSPRPGTPYRQAGGEIRLVGTTEEGRTVELDPRRYLKFDSLRTHLALRISVPRHEIDRLGLARVAVAVGENMTLVPDQTAEVEPAMRRALYGIAALAILSGIMAMGPEGSPLTRILLLFETVVAFAGTAWIAIHARRAGRDQGGWLRVASAVTSTVTILLGVALAANVFGWLGLLKMLTEGSIASLFGAFAWTIVVTATAALFPAILDRSIGRVLPSLRRKKAVVCRIVLRIVASVAVIAWSQGVLIRFQVWQRLRVYATAVAESALSIGGLTLSTGGLLGAILIAGCTWVVARLAGFFTREEVFPRLHMGRGAGDSVVTLTNYIIYGVGVAMAASAIGLGGTQLTVVIGALGVGIGFGLQDIVNNFVSGLILIFERPIRVGDTIQTVEHWGRVERIGIRASTIRSLEGAEIIVPNGDLIAREVINWTRSDDMRRIEVFVGVAYGTEPEVVLEILGRVADEHPLTLGEPAPKAQLIGFGESSLDFRLRCWTPVEDWPDVHGDLHVALNKELKKAGVTIPFPQRDLHIQSTVAVERDTSRTVIEAVQGSD